jgi:hypothetical protein
MLKHSRGLGIVALAVLLSACGAEATPSPVVASLGTAGTSAPATSSAQSDAGRPQMRLDDTPEDRKRLGQPYTNCLKQHGVKVLTGRGPDSLEQTGEPKEAYQACAGLIPLFPPELDPTKNVHFADQFRDQINCMRAKGAKVHSVEDTSVFAHGLTWTYDDGVTQTLSEAQLDEVDHACQLKAFGH